MDVNCFYVVGAYDEVLFKHCNCICVPYSLVQCSIWPATPVEVNLGQHYAWWNAKYSFGVWISFKIQF